MSGQGTHQRGKRAPKVGHVVIAAARAGDDRHDFAGGALLGLADGRFDFKLFRFRDHAGLSLPIARCAAAAEIAAAAGKAAAVSAAAASAAAAASPAAGEEDRRAVAGPSRPAAGKRLARLLRLRPEHEDENANDEEERDQPGSSRSLLRGHGGPFGGAFLYRLGVAKQHVLDIVDARLDARWRSRRAGTRAESGSG